MIPKQSLDGQWIPESPNLRKKRSITIGMAGVITCTITHHREAWAGSHFWLWETGVGEHEKRVWLHGWTTLRLDTGSLWIVNTSSPWTPQEFPGRWNDWYKVASHMTYLGVTAFDSCWLAPFLEGDHMQTDLPLLLGYCWWPLSSTNILAILNHPLTIILLQCWLLPACHHYPSIKHYFPLTSNQNTAILDFS